MIKFSSLLFNLSSLSAAIASACTDQFDASCYNTNDIVTRNIAIIGGGSSGTYAAIKIRDSGQTVTVIESQAQLGGHTQTYTVPGTGFTIDYGVQLFWNTSVVTDFFARLNVPIVPFRPSGNATTVYVDMTTGERLPDFVASKNFTIYHQQLQKYPYLAWGYDMPSPVPMDLYLPFGDFVSKYGLQDVAFSIFHHAATGGLGDMMQKPTVSIFKALSEVVFKESQGAAVVTATNNNHQLYDSALEALGQDVLLNSTVVAAFRPLNNSSDAGVRLIVQTPAGKKLVIVSQLLFTAPQTTENLNILNLDNVEHGVFTRFNVTGFYSGLLRNTGLPAGFNFVNVGSKTKYNIPAMPGLYHIQPTAVKDIWSFWYTSDGVLPEATVKRMVVATVNLLRNSSTSMGDSEFLAFGYHTPYHLYPPAEKIRDGFYNNLESLQGYRNTWYTGSLFEPAAGPLWVFTQSLIAKIVATV